MLEEMGRAINGNNNENVIVNDRYSGFHQRNAVVAQSEVILAFTFGEGPEPKDGGTMDTWKKSKSKKKIHIPCTPLLLAKKVI
jgi:hypothetical protein